MSARRLSAVIVTVTLASIVGGAWSPAYAQESSDYGSSVVTGRSATISVAAAGFPAATLTLPATGGTLTAPTGTGRPLKASSPFGARYGSAVAQPYLATNMGNTSPLTTTLKFAADTPATGWGFSLGDIDAEKVQVIPVDAAGNDLPVATLGFQGSFDYDASDDATKGVDLPSWDPVTGTLSGHGTTVSSNPLNDTKGASGWFQPTQPIAGLRFVFTNLTNGLPQSQLWIAARTAAVSGTVVEPTTRAPAPDVPVVLETPAGDPLPTPGSPPVETRTDAAGKYSFPAVVEGTTVVVAVDPPAGATAVGVTRRTVVVSADVTVPAFVVHTAPLAGPTPTPPSSSPRPTPTVSPTTSVTPPQLPATGHQVRPELVLGGVFLLAGCGCLFAARRPIAARRR